MVLRRALLAFVKGALLWNLALGYPNPKPNPSPDGCCQPGPSCFNPCQGAMPQTQSSDCCQPGPTCQNPCQTGSMYQSQSLGFTPVQSAGQSGCCSPPSATCDNPCQGPMAAFSSPSISSLSGFGGGFGNGGFGNVGFGNGGFGNGGFGNGGFGNGGFYSGSYVGGYSAPATNSKVVYAPYPGEITFKLQQNWNPDTLLDHASPAYQILAGNVASAIKAVLGPATFVNNVYFREGYVPGNPSSQPKVVVHCMVNGGSDAAGVLATSVKPDGTLGDGLKVYKDSFNAF